MGTRLCFGWSNGSTLYKGCEDASLFSVFFDFMFASYVAAYFDIFEIKRTNIDQSLPGLAFSEREKN